MSAMPRGFVDLVVNEDETPIQLLKQIFVTLQTRRLRGPADARAVAEEETLHGLLQDLAEREPIRIQRSGPHLLVDRTRVRPHPEVRLLVKNLVQDLDRFGIGGLVLDPALDKDSLRSFLDAYPRLDAVLLENDVAVKVTDSRGDDRIVLEEEVEIVPGVVIFPYNPESAEEGLDPTERRRQARRTFFKALKAARHIFKQAQLNRIAELRKTRAVVHEMIDTVVEEEFSLLGLAAIHSFDEYTFQHSVHVAVLSVALGQRLGLARSELSSLGVAAMFHDVGKTRVPRRVLWKPGRYDKDEWRIMRKHPLAGARELLRMGGSSDLAVRVMLVSCEHHMRYDGSGYPKLGDDWQQGLYSRIVALADCFDAMTASRVYMERPFTPDAVVRYMLENAGRMFDPDLLREFVGLIGLYPVGSLVRLENGELAVVTEPPATAAEVERPRVRILLPGDHGFFAGDERSLSDGPAVDPRYRIKASCHPLDFGVEMDDLLEEHYLDDVVESAA
ncbi:MAG: HD-GYP domain-containing protein [Candidatus Eisenbacteria bacterium]|uniref:HD-GYP domain-containing protein n=1 Tax=Eiseniibacteriota bacterium TaxID=2212470 RepID=A0A956SBG9_UNCEI|nr:HD-GYP domain-containing protein [Candidatus Eisenbacteria bacterium]